MADPRADATGEDYTDYYDEQAAATGWYGPQVVFGLLAQRLRPGETVLDVGIGTGLGSEPFARAGLRVLGMDISAEMLEAVRAKGISKSLEVHDLTSVPYPYDDGSVDHIICVGVLQFFGDVAPVFREAARIMKDGGAFAFTIIDREAGEPEAIIVSGEHTGGGRTVVMHRLAPENVHALLAEVGLVVRDELEFAAYMDAERASRLPLRAYVAVARD